MRRGRAGQVARHSKGLSKVRGGGFGTSIPSDIQRLCFVRCLENAARLESFRLLCLEPWGLAFQTRGLPLGFRVLDDFTVRWELFLGLVLP